MHGLNGTPYPDCRPEIPGVAGYALTATVGGVVGLGRPHRVRPHLGRRLRTVLQSPGLPQLSALLKDICWLYIYGLATYDCFRCIIRC